MGKGAETGKNEGITNKTTSGQKKGMDISLGGWGRGGRVKKKSRTGGKKRWLPGHGKEKKRGQGKDQSGGSKHIKPFQKRYGGGNTRTRSLVGAIFRVQRYRKNKKDTLKSQKPHKSQN